MKIVKTIHVIGFSLLLPRPFLPHPFSINKQKNKSTRGISLRNIHTLASESAEKLGSWPKKSGKETCQSCASQNFYIYIFVCPSCLVTISINQPSKSFRKFKVYSNNLISIVISLSVSLKTIILVLLLSFLYESSY